MIIIKLPDGKKISLTPEQWEKCKSYCKHDAYCELHCASTKDEKRAWWMICKKTIFHLLFSLLLLSLLIFLLRADIATALTTTGTIEAAIIAFKEIS